MSKQFGEPAVAHSEEMGTSGGRGEISRSVARALHILLDVAHSSRPLSFSDLQRRHDLPKATLHKLLTTLETLSFLRRHVASGKYTLGLATVEMSAAASTGPDDLPSLFAPILERLVRQWNETCHFGVVENGQDVILKRLDPADQVVRLGPLNSPSKPVYATAGGLAALGVAGIDILGEKLPDWLHQSTPNTIASRTELHDRIEQVREDGYALDLEEAYIGVRCVAVAIAAAGWPVFYVSFSLPLQRATIERLKELARPLQAAADEMRRVLEVLPAR